MTKIVDVLNNFRIVDDSGFDRNDIKSQVVLELNLLRESLESVLLDVKFMTEHSVISPHVIDCFIYQRALELMTPEFIKEFNND